MAYFSLLLVYCDGTVPGSSLSALLFGIPPSPYSRPLNLALKNHSISYRKCIEFYPCTRGTRVSREQAPKTSTGSCDFGVKMSEDGELNHATRQKQGAQSDDVVRLSASVKGYVESLLGLDHEFALMDAYSDRVSSAGGTSSSLASAWTQVWYWRIARWRWPCAR